MVFLCTLDVSRSPNCYLPEGRRQKEKFNVVQQPKISFLPLNSYMVINLLFHPLSSSLFQSTTSLILSVRTPISSIVLPPPKLDRPVTIEQAASRHNLPSRPEVAPPVLPARLKAADGRLRATTSERIHRAQNLWPDERQSSIITTLWRISRLSLLRLRLPHPLEFPTQQPRR
jgi:hypothetical protein